MNAPVAITTSVDEGYLVVGQMGEISEKPDSLLGFYENGELLGKFTTPLSDITGLAYGVKKKPARLYAIDYNWSDTSKGGLFKIIADKENPMSNCLAEKLIPLDKPTAMVFDATGNLYITLIGTSLPGIEGPSGRLIKIKGLEDPKKKKKDDKDKKDGDEKDGDKVEKEGKRTSTFK